MIPSPLTVTDRFLFFDLSGTLMQVDGRLSEAHRTVLHEIGRVAGGIGLVTGQPRKDPQVEQVFSVFSELSRRCIARFCAYTTRGGARWYFENGEILADRAYSEKFALTRYRMREIVDVAEAVLAAQALHPLIPVTTLDGCAVRINLVPQERPAFRQALASRLPELQVVAEGRTSVFVLHKDTGKGAALLYEIENDVPKAGLVYFGDELSEGNDREILNLEGIEVWSVGRPIPKFNVRTIGETPADLFRALEYAVEKVNR